MNNLTVMTRVIGVVSGKGGVGKTTTVVNIGAVLSHDFKKNTVVVDTNVSSSNLSLHLGAHFHPITINNVLKGEANVSETIVKHPSGLKIVPASLSVDDLFVDSQNLPQIINELKKDHEIIILDTAPSIGEETLNALKICDEVLIVTNPNLPAVTDALKTIKLAEKLNIPVTGVIVNMFRKDAPLTIKDIEYMCNYKAIGIVYFDRKVDESIMKKIPLVHYDPKSKASKGFKKVSAQLMGAKYEEEKGILEKILNFFLEPEEE